MILKNKQICELLHIHKLFKYKFLIRAHVHCIQSVFLLLTLIGLNNDFLLVLITLNWSLWTWFPSYGTGNYSLKLSCLFVIKTLIIVFCRF